MVKPKIFDSVRDVFLSVCNHLLNEKDPSCQCTTNKIVLIQKNRLVSNDKLQREMSNAAKIYNPMSQVRRNQADFRKENHYWKNPCTSQNL